MLDPSTPLLQQLGEILQANDGVHAYILVDPMLREPLAQYVLDDNDAVVQPIPVRHPSLADDQRPRLVSLPPKATGLLAASLHAAQSEQEDPNQEANAGFVVGGWLLSEANIDEVARHLARVIGSCIVQGKGRRLVRLADRRVLEWLWPMLGTQQRRSLLGPLTSWITLDRCGRLVSRGRDQAETDTSAHGTLTLGAGQWARLQQCELVQAMLRGWQQFSPTLPADYLAQAANAVDAAQTLGLSNQRDILLLGAYQLQIHPRLCTHPHVTRAVAQATEDRTPLFEALGAIPDPDGWDAIRQQLEYSGASARSNAPERA